MGASGALETTTIRSQVIGAQTRLHGLTSASSCSSNVATKHRVTLPHVDKVQLETLRLSKTEEKYEAAKKAVHSSRSSSRPWGNSSRNASTRCLCASPSSAGPGSQLSGTSEVSPTATSSTAHAPSKCSKTYGLPCLLFLVSYKDHPSTPSML